ncbi:MAG: 23S rRNA (guanosine(2251)-2'-O)-methyltransferase RlmB [Spirochaetaceae bacterium]|jgi:23S rRNA (guanosine2251-2'-O)-methyltransferase|nr:23S rRNA (guanosine(2251)-2'-O)-methyltransferase RlmB [Spirochaetaceae bacterium]
MAYLTGFHGIEERLKARGSCAALLVAKPGPRSRTIIALAKAQKVRIERVGTHELDRIAPDHRGIALEVEDRKPARILSVECFIEELGEKRNSLAVVLDEITDPHNYGAILRSCDQFGADLVITRPRRTAKHAEVVARTSAGAVSWVPAVEAPNLPRALQLLKQGGFWVYGADMAGDPAYTKDFRGRVCLVLGGEGAGITRLLREQCDALVAIPSQGALDSLNVSVAAGILLYEIRRPPETGGTARPQPPAVS